MRIVIEGDPIPLARPRASKHRFYDPQFQVKQNLSWIVKQQFTQEPLSYIDLIKMTFLMKLPSSWSNKKKARLNNTYHTQRPDLSNMIKMIEDALNNIVWTDDCIIANLIAKKLWSYEPATIIEVL